MRHYVAVLYPELLSSISRGLLRPIEFFIAAHWKMAFAGFNRFICLFVFKKKEAICVFATIAARCPLQEMPIISWTEIAYFGGVSGRRGLLLNRSIWRGFREILWSGMETDAGCLWCKSNKTNEVTTAFVVYRYFVARACGHFHGDWIIDTHRLTRWLSAALHSPLFNKATLSAR